MIYNNHKVYFEKKGYAIVWINGKNKKVHILEWEKYNGKKPVGMQIHHIDENKGNWNINNLKLVSQSDHLKIHAGWVEENGVWILKPCKDCKRKLPLNKFYQRKGLTPSQRCRECSVPYFKEVAKDPKFKKRRKSYMQRYYKSNKEKFI